MFWTIIALTICTIGWLLTPLAAFVRWVERFKYESNRHRWYQNNQHKFPVDPMIGR